MGNVNSTLPAQTTHINQLINLVPLKVFFYQLKDSSVATPGQLAAMTL